MTPRNYLYKMLNALTSAYTQKDLENVKFDKPLETNIGKLFSLFAEQIEEVQRQAELIKLWDDLDYAQGKVLDRYGANFGVKRVSESDKLYRIMIRVKMLAQISGGDVDTVLHATSELLDVDVTNILYEDRFPAKIGLYVDQDLLSEDIFELIDEIGQSIKRILAAGVGMRLYLRTYHTYKEVVNVSFGGSALTYIDGQINEPSRADQLDVNTSNMLFCSTNALGQIPAVQTSHALKHNDTSGTLYHTHITSKRIE